MLQACLHKTASVMSMLLHGMHTAYAFRKKLGDPNTAAVTAFWYLKRFCVICTSYMRFCGFHAVQSFHGCILAPCQVLKTYLTRACTV